MSFLYPRLLPGRARDLLAEYRSLPLPELAARASVGDPSAVYVATGGDRVPPDRLRHLRTAVVDLATHAGYPDPATKAAHAEFDLSLAGLLHAQSGMVPAEAASRDVWAFLSLVLLPEVAAWRYPSRHKDRMRGTDLTRHVFGRMWWRAHLVHDAAAPDPYAALHILGEAAFDQIYARRAALGGSPHLVRAILRVWQGVDRAGVPERETLQDFLKRLLRLAPFVLFDAVDSEALDEELRAVVQESVQARLLARGRVTPQPEVDGPTRPLVPAARTAGNGASVVATQVRPLTSVEICAGSGAQAFGLERAGFSPVLLVDSKDHACDTLKLNRPSWEVVHSDLVGIDPAVLPEPGRIDLLSGGLPRLRSAASAGRGQDEDERAVLWAAVGLVGVLRPRAVLLENLPDLVEAEAYAQDRVRLEKTLAEDGYQVSWKILDAADFNVPQHRRSGFLLAMREPWSDAFTWPDPLPGPRPTVGAVLGPSMASRGWAGAERWAAAARRAAPALVGGSDRRGGADLGPTGSKNAWSMLRVNGISLGDEVPGPDFEENGSPRLTVEQAALVQSFPQEWQFAGGKTSRYRQIGHALPPPVAEAVGAALARALRS